MKNLLLAVAFCCFCATINAQIVVTASNYNAFFNSGSIQITDSIPTISPGIAGANVTWNFSGLNSHVSKANTFMAASAGLLGSSFPSADVCLKQDTNYFYYDSSTTKLSYWGFAGNFLGINTNSAIVYGDPETILTFPSTYNTSFNDNASYDNYFLYNTTYQGYFVDSIRQKSDITVTSVIDGWGTITTPNATMPCIRQNISKHTIDTTWAKVVVGGFSSWIELYNDDATTQSYSYISNVGGGLIATIEYFADSNAIAEVRWNPVTIPTVTLASQINLLCNGASTGSATVSATGGVSPYSFTWSNGQTGATATGLPAGTYTVTAYDAVNSFSTLSVIITQPTAVTGTITSIVNPNCATCATGSGTVVGSGGTSPYTYSWSNGQSSATSTGLTTGSYTVTVNDFNSCTGSVSVTLDTLMSVNAEDYNAFFYPGNTMIVDTTPTVTPGTAGANVTWYLFSLNSHLTKSNSFIAPSAGLLGSLFTNASVCMKEDTNYYYYDSTITRLEYWGFAGNVLNIGTNDAIVFDNPETILTFPSTYNTGFNDVSSYDSYFEYNAFYQGYWVDSIRQKMVTSTVSIIDGWGKVVTPNATIPCIRQNIMKNIIDTTWAKITVGGNSYWIELYNSNDNVQSYSYISNAGGGLIASIEFEPNSSIVAQASWNPISLPVATISSKTNALCNGASTGSATVSATGGTSPYSYLWSNGQTSSTATGLAKGDFFVTVTDSQNATGTAFVNINEPAPLNPVITSQVNATCSSCTDGSGTVAGSGGTSPYSYSWSNGQTSSTATGLAFGASTVTITDANSCTATAIFNIDTILIINSEGYTFFQYGNDLIIDTVPTVTPGNAGANVTYDLTALNTHLFSSNLFMDPSAGVLGSSYPEANVAVNQDTLFHYFDFSSLMVDYWGSAGNILANGTNNAQVYSNPATVLTFPLTYNTAFNDTAFHDNTYAYNALYQGIFVDSLREKETIITSSVVDGWGTINTPNESFQGIRQNVMKHHIDSTWAKIFVGGFHYWIEVYNDTFNVQTYNFISNASGNNIVTLEYYADSNAIVEAKWNPMTLPVVTATPTNILCTGSNNGSATASVTGGKSPYSYSWNTLPAQTGATATGLAPGTYQVVVMDSINNSDSISFTITEPATALTTSVSSTDASCGNSDGNATVAPAGGTTSYTYLWSDGQATASATALGAGSFMVTVTDANGCMDSIQADISNIGAPTISEDSLVHITCNGGSDGIAYMSATGGTGSSTFAWDVTPPQTDSTATGLSAGVYTLSVTDASSCLAVQSVTITEPDVLSASIDSQTDVSCFGDSNGVATVTVIGGTSGYSYSWNTAPAQLTSSSTGLKAGSYTVTIVDANSCSTTANVTITEPVVLTASVSAQTNVDCNGNSNGSATVTGVNGTSPYSYEWDTTPVQNSATASGLIEGTYSVTVTDANSCSNSTTVTITQPAILTASISASTNVSCNGGSDGSATVTVGGGTTGYSYLWSNSQTTSTASGLSLGLHTVTVTDDNGCIQTATATISEPSALNASISSQTDVSCFGDSNGVATVSPVGGTTGYTYTWSTSPAQTTASATGLKMGSFTVTVTDANGCTKTATAAITEPAVLSSTVTQTNVSCFSGSNGSATLTPAGGTPGYSINWSTTPAQNTATATGLTQGIYSVSISDSKGCTATNTVTITEPTALTAAISAQTNILCFGEAQGTATVTPAGGTSAYSYEWSSVPAQTLATATGLSAGNYTVTLTDAQGCTQNATAIITQPSALDATVSVTNLSCFGDSVGYATVTANGGSTGYSYNWNTTPSQTSSTASGLIAGTYTVVVTDTNGCTKTATATITEPSAVTSAITFQTDLLCNGDSNGVAVVTAAGGTSGYTYVWNTVPQQTTDTATGLPGGAVTGTATDANGCSITFTATISEPAALTVATTFTDIACNGDNTGIANAIVTGGTTPYSFLWSDVDGQTGISATGLGADTYTVSITDSNSCSTTATATVTEPTALLASKTETNVLCNGDSSGSASVTVSGGTSPYSYLWSDGQILNSASGLYAGTFSVLITDSNLCTLSDTVILTEPAILTTTAIMVNDVSCFGGNDGSASASATGGTSPYTYLWSNGSPNPSAGQLIAGNIMVTVTDTNSCSVSDTVSIVQPAAALVASTTTTSVIDSAATGTVSVIATGGTSPYIYDWSTTPAQDSSTAIGLAPGVYSVTVTDDNGCTFVATDTVTSLVSIGSMNTINYSIVAFPNPSNGQFNLEIVSQMNVEVQVTITDVKGQLVYNKNVNLVSGKNNHSVSLESGSNGMYMIQLISKDGIVRLPVTLMK